MSPDTTQIVGFVLVVVIAAFLLWQGKQTLTIANAVANVKSAIPLAVEVKTAAEIAVMAAEEYGRTGKLTTGKDKLTFAIKVFKRWVPLSRGVSDEDMLAAIHSIVPVANAVTAQLEAAKAVVAAPSKPNALPTTIYPAPGRPQP